MRDKTDFYRFYQGYSFRSIHIKPKTADRVFDRCQGWNMYPDSGRISFRFYQGCLFRSIHVKPKTADRVFDR
jgi:hypothetical protein